MFDRLLLRNGHLPATPHLWLSNALLTVYEFVAVAPTITNKISVNVTVITIHDPAQHPVALARTDVATQSAMHADRWRKLHVPFARVVMLVGGIGKYPRRTYLIEIARKFALQHAVFVASEVGEIANAEDIKVFA